jgi:putative SOS response-associated peptidase YedK
MKQGELFALGGLWESWESEQGEVIDSAVILTTRPNELVGEVHDRMPVIIPAGGYQRWLDPEVQKFEDVSDLLEPFPADRMVAHPVSKKVNRPDFDLPECIEPIEAD